MGMGIWELYLCVDLHVCIRAPSRHSASFIKASLHLES
jgi:hypothetical protein